MAASGRSRPAGGGLALPGWNRWWNGVPADAAGPHLAEGVGCVLVLRRSAPGPAKTGYGNNCYVMSSKTSHRRPNCRCPV